MNQTIRGFDFKPIEFERFRINVEFISMGLPQPDHLVRISLKKLLLPGIGKLATKLI